MGRGFFRPSGTGLARGAKPSDESPGYSRSSLRDWPPRAAPVTKNEVRPFKSAGKPDALQTLSRPPERLAHAERLECGEALLPLSVRQ